MQITGIEELSKSRCKVYIDREFAFVLYKGELRLYHVSEGEELSEESYRTIVQEVLPKRAKVRAMNLLKSREYTTSQLRAKLEQGLYPPEAVEAALDYVASFHYTDDCRYACNYIRCHEQDRSRRRMEQDLRKKGLSADLIKRAFSEWEKSGGEQDETRMIQELLRKRHYNFEGADWKEQQKQYAFLMRKGFSVSAIRRAMGVMDSDFD